MPIATNEMLTALRRKRGENNLKVSELAKETGVSRWTLDQLLSGKRTVIHARTEQLINLWLYKQL